MGKETESAKLSNLPQITPLGIRPKPMHISFYDAGGHRHLFPPPLMSTATSCSWDWRKASLCIWQVDHPLTATISWVRTVCLPDTADTHRWAWVNSHNTTMLTSTLPKMRMSPRENKYTRPNRWLGRQSWVSNLGLNPRLLFFLKISCCLQKEEIPNVI